MLDHIKQKIKVYFKIFTNKTTMKCLLFHSTLRNLKKRNLSKIMPQGFCNCVSIMLMTTAIRKQMTN